MLALLELISDSSGECPPKEEKKKHRGEQVRLAERRPALVERKQKRKSKRGLPKRPARKKAFALEFNSRAQKMKLRMGVQPSLHRAPRQVSLVGWLQRKKESAACLIK